MAVSRDGKTVAAGVRYGTVKVWDVRTGKERTLKGHVSDVWGVVFTPDGKTLISGNGDWDQAGDVKLWDWQAEKEHAALKHSGEVLCLAVSPDGSLAAGSWDKTIKVWELERSRAKRRALPRRLLLTVPLVSLSPRLQDSSFSDHQVCP